MRVLILEDEPLIARRLERLTRDILGSRLEQIQCVPDIASATTLMEGGAFSVLLLDLNLSGDDGFAVLHRALVEPFQTIVVSATTDRAIEAFELGVVDFVPKPFTVERLAKAFARLGQKDPEAQTRLLAVSIAGKVELVPLGSVVAIHGDDDYSSIQTLDGRRHLHRKTLAALENLLPPNFQRVHRSHLVNTDHLVRIVSQDGGARTIVLAGGTEVPVGRSYTGAISKRFIG